MFNAEIKSGRDEDICILIKVDNHSYNYICECGEAKALSVKECQNTQAIFISHTHIDHFVNFDTILRHQIGTNKRVVISGPKGIIEQVQNRIKSYTWNLIEENSISYEVREIRSKGDIRSVILNPPEWKREEEKTISGDIIFKEKDFHVEYEILNHKTDSIAYLFRGVDKVKIELDKELQGGKWVSELKKAYTDKDDKALIKINEQDFLAKDLFHMIKMEKGKTLGIIMDHAASEENHEKIKSTFQEVNKVYIESFYMDEDKELAEKNFHSYAAMSGKIMKACQVGKAVPVHFSRKYEAEEIERLIEQFEKAMS